MAKKVAYAVFVGRTSGVYNTWDQAKKQVDGFPGNKYRGYTLADGGRAEAEKEYRASIGKAPGTKPQSTERVTLVATSGLPSGPPETRNNPVNPPSPLGQHQLSRKERKDRFTSHTPIQERWFGRETQGKATPPNQVTLKPETSSHPTQSHLSDISRQKKGRPASWESEYETPQKTHSPGAPGQEKDLNYTSGNRDSPSSSSLSDSSTEGNGSTRNEPSISSRKAHSSGPNSPLYVFTSGVTLPASNIGAAPETISAAKPPFISSEGSDSRSVYNTNDLPSAVNQVVPNEGRSQLIMQRSSLPYSGFDADSAPDYISLNCPDYDDPSESSPLESTNSPSAPPPTEPELCEEQSNLVNLITSGVNVFYTGSAGCGKSTVLKAFVRRLKESGKIVKIIAPTGRAALGVDGSTFWSYAGWHPDSMKRPLTKLKNDARYHRYVNKRLCKTDVLVIDEISMVENHHFERLNQAMKAARNNTYKFSDDQAELNSKAPFGGVQLVVTGDFCQLPPVKPFKYCLHCGHQLHGSQDGEAYNCHMEGHGPFYDVDKWSFRSAAWKECNFTHVNLSHIHRQSDKEFITMLQKLRFGKQLSTEDRDLLLDHHSETTNAVKLFPLVKQVREVNGEAFARLDGPMISFDCLDSYNWNKDHSNLSKNWARSEDDSLRCLDQHQFEKRVEMKRGMLVVLLVNLDIDLGLINGAQGIILGFLSHDPTKLPEQIGQHADLKKSQIESFVDRAESKLWPLVKFESKGKSFTRLIKPYCAVSELGESTPYSWVSRTQIPLLAAWAMSIHKSQGMTLSRVEISVSKSFEKGQAYVALSRATSLDGLKVHSLGDCDQEGNEQVMEFLREKFSDGVVDDLD